MQTKARIYEERGLAVGDQIQLSEKNSHYLANVLRLKPGDMITIFNGQGGEYIATLIALSKKRVTLMLKQFVAREVESSLTITLGQGIAKGDKMDFIVQKAVELGVTAIYPLITTRCNVKLDRERLVKRVAHWQSVANSACEQSGRNRIPWIYPATPLMDWIIQPKVSLNLVLDPLADKKLTQLPLAPKQSISLLIGSEGGLTPLELEKAVNFGFQAINLGPRILRTETAGLSILSILQYLVGDIGC
jgi:16S rRNA (uracil1498-N3)-methyltransferase